MTSHAVRSLALLLMSPVAGADDFCEFFDTVLAAAPSGFQQLRGRDLFGDGEAWASQVMAPGAYECEVLAFKNDDPDFHCRWQYSKFRDAAELMQQASAMAKGLESCLAEPKWHSRAVVTSRRDNGGDFLVLHPSGNVIIDLRVSANPTRSILDLWVTPRPKMSAGEFSAELRNAAEDYPKRLPSAN